MAPRQYGDVRASEAFVLIDGVIRGVLAEPRGGLVSIGVVLALWSASAGFLG
jgi:uncharacterized BrkB/YihY/UPF0761 family membrane protein